MAEVKENREQYFHKEVSGEEFHNELRRAERAMNVGCITTYDATQNVTNWYACGYLGYSKGRVGESTAYFLSVPYAQSDAARQPAQKEPT